MLLQKHPYDSNPRFKTLRDIFQHLPLSDIVDAWKEGKESINECANILLNKMKSTSDVQQLQDQYASCLKFDIYDGDNDGGDDVDEDKKYSSVNTKINTLIDAGILKEVLKHKMYMLFFSTCSFLPPPLYFFDKMRKYPVCEKSFKP